VKRGERQILEDEVRLRKVADKPLNDGLDGLAVRALKVSELDEFELFVRRPAAGSVSALLEDTPGIGVRVGSKGQNVGRDQVLFVWRDVEHKISDLLLRIALLRNEDGHLTDVGRGRGLDRLHLPDTVRVVSP
jgi:hypothetical protein